MFGRLGYDGQWRHNGLVSGAAALIRTAKAADSPSRGWRAPWWAWPGPWWAGSTRGSGRRGRGRGRGRGSCRRGSRATARCSGTPAPPAQGQRVDFVLFQILFRLVVFRYLLFATLYIWTGEGRNLLAGLPRPSSAPGSESESAASTLTLTLAPPVVTVTAAPGTLPPDFWRFLGRYL